MAPLEFPMSCAKATWRGREAYRLANNLIEIVTLAGGGHIAEFRFRQRTSLPDLNPLWSPPWNTIDPYKYRPSLHSIRYGSRREGQLLSGLAGHNICLDYFGPPSEEELEMGLSFHGEAPNLRWHKRWQSAGSHGAGLTLSVKLPVAELKFTRTMSVVANEPLVYFKETIENPKKTDHYFQWAEHVTLGPPFLSNRSSYVVIPAREGLTDPRGYEEGKTLLRSGCKFLWPKAPTEKRQPVDLSRPFTKKGKGFVCTFPLSRGREVAFVAAVNTHFRMIIGYCFARSDFPWVALWEENCAVDAPPWNRRTQARGLEFSNSPFPAGRHDAICEGPLFGIPAISRLPARGSKSVHYCAFLASLPEGLGNVADILVHSDEIQILGRGQKSFSLKASGLRHFPWS